MFTCKVYPGPFSQRCRGFYLMQRNKCWGVQQNTLYLNNVIL